MAEHSPPMRAHPLTTVVIVLFIVAAAAITWRLMR